MELKQIGVRAVQAQKEPSETALIKIELLFGERVHVLGYQGEWAEVQTDDLDQYVGYVPKGVLVEPYDPTHRVVVRFAPIYHTPNFKNPIAGEPLYFNSLVRVEESRETSEGLMHKLKGFGWVFDVHLMPVDYRSPDFLVECLKFLDCSYGYERRGALIDCSTLVQAGCKAAGIPCPYDVKSGEMEKLGEAVDFAPDLSNLKRGDLVFWTQDKGSHVAIMVDEKSCFHATTADPYHKAFIQPLVDTAKDQARDGNGPITMVRRFPDYQPT